MSDEISPSFSSAIDYNVNPAITADLTRWLLTPDELRERLEHDLRNEVMVEKEDGTLMWIPLISPLTKKPVPPLLNEAGIRQLMSVYNTYVNKNTLFSNFDDDKIEIFITHLRNDTIELIFLKGESHFGAQFEDWTTILNLVVDPVYICLESAYGGGLRETLAKSIREIRNINPQQPQPQSSTSRGLFGWFKGMGR